MAPKNQQVMSTIEKHLLISKCEKPYVIFNMACFKHLIFSKHYLDNGNVVRLSNNDITKLICEKGKWQPSIFKYYKKAIRDNKEELLNYLVPTFDGTMIPLFSLVGCGKCDFCRYKKTQQLQIRSLCESMYSTTRPLSLLLTYDDKHLPYEGVNKPDLQKFFKRLRIYLKRHPCSTQCGYKDNLRYFCCGEYGSKRQRPHYHLILWNFPDIIFHQSKYLMYRDLSNLFTDIWTNGRVFVKYTDDNEGSTTSGITYCVKYLNKEGCTPFRYVKDICDFTGEEIVRKESLNKPFVTFSRGRGKIQGLGSQWLNDHKEEILCNKHYKGKYTWCFNNEKITAPLPTYFIDKLLPRVSSIIPTEITDIFADFQKIIPYLYVHEDDIVLSRHKSVTEAITELNFKYWFLPQTDTHTHYYLFDDSFIIKTLSNLEKLFAYEVPQKLTRELVFARLKYSTEAQESIVTTKYSTFNGSLDEYYAIQSYYNKPINPKIPDDQ